MQSRLPSPKRLVCAGTPHYGRPRMMTRLQLIAGYRDFCISMTGSLEGTEAASESRITIDENEVKEITESIHEAQYFDASSMAPLTPAALVSLSYVRLEGHT
jgi:hypothetical protein